MIRGKRGVAAILLVELTLGGCWANPSAVKINSYPPGAKVLYQRQQLGLTPLQTVLACEYDTQFVHLELPGYPSYTVALRKRPITYYGPWDQGPGRTVWLPDIPPDSSIKEID
jgi:hypothetical protein